MQARTIRIGTRGSPLALAQTNDVRRRLMAAHGLPEGSVEIIVIKTSGDRIQDRPLSEVGGKGLFTKELEEALLSGAIDLAVHSMKDMQTALPEGLSIGAVLEREDVRDAFISLKYKSLAEVPKGAVIGTSSLRRRAQVRRLRPDLEVVEFRGNVETRLKKLQDGVADATFLATAGLRRLGMADRITAMIPTSEMLPAVAQGAVGIEIRANDEAVAELVAPLDHQPTAICVAAERAYLARLEGSCRTPIGGLARLENGTLTMSGQILKPDGSESYARTRSGTPAQALAIGDALASELLAEAGPGFLAALAG